MEHAKISNMVNYENWVRMLNRNTKISDEVKLKPKAPSSILDKKLPHEKKEDKIITSELWLG
ncbi:MAG: hypothetical protein U5K00_10735 [Melioribacteraceae bacterium]|nr:hypothetical protein [Melioribacteraceae bacterium]